MKAFVQRVQKASPIKGGNMGTDPALILADSLPYPPNVIDLK